MKKAHFLLLIVVVVAAFIFIKNEPNTKPSKNSGLANPASVYCSQKGGNNVVFTLGNGAQSGLCVFEKNYTCEQWAMMEGNCPIGGIDTSKYDNVGQRYCKWLGGSTSAGGTICVLPNKHSCATASLYAGTCN